MPKEKCRLRCMCFQFQDQAAPIFKWPSVDVACVHAGEDSYPTGLGMLTRKRVDIVRRVRFFLLANNTTLILSR